MAKPCPDCGGHRWAAAGYCLEMECAGHYLDADYPRSAPPEHKWYVQEPVKKSIRKTAPKVRMPRKGALRSTELWYEERGETPPWKQKDEHA